LADLPLLLRPSAASTEGYISELGKRDVFRELSLDLEKEMASDRTAQVSAMEVEE
jgi:hypothetical protein